MDKSNSKIIIIGAKGMLGQELVKVFESDFEVFAWDKKDIDITQEKQLKEKITKIKPAIIINAAAYNAVDKCEEDEQEFEIAQKINGEAPGYLAKIAKENNIILIHYSSDYVFSGDPEAVSWKTEPTGCTHHCATCSLHQGFVPEIGFKEDDNPDPVSKYGESKLLGEKKVQEKGKKYYIIRLSKLFGIPAFSDKAKKSFFDIMLALGKNPPADGEVKVVDEETSCFTYAPDLAKKTKEIIESKKPFGIYHVTNSESCTWYEAVLELYKQARIKTKVIPINSEDFSRPAKRPYYSVLLNTKLNPLRSYKEALKDFLSQNKSK